MELGLTGASVLITGASRGIGRAVAEAFAVEGANLFLVARDPTRLKTAAVEIAAAHGAEVETLSVDLGQPGAIDKVFAFCPGADILVNNAGGMVGGDLLNVDEAAWRASWEVKVFGYINLTRAFYRAMTARGAGVVVNVVGIGAEKFDYTYAAGSSGNAALAAFTRNTGSSSLDFGVRVVGVHPGWTRTERLSDLFDHLAEKQTGDPRNWDAVLETWGLTRLVEPKEVADTVIFLASSRASGISGDIVTIDLGYTHRNYTTLRREGTAGRGSET